jgi:Tripartite tricarboxylate transporter family receptor
VAEFVPGFEASAWFGVGAPKDTPSQIIDRLNETINAGLAVRAAIAECPLWGANRKTCAQSEPYRF